MTDKITFALVGTVSCGKSTLLNSIFCRDLSQSSIKRTTMDPIIFSENNTISNDLEQSKIIYSEIGEINSKIIKTTEKGLKRKSCNELKFEVGKIDINIMDKSLINIIDVPGLNDARTKSIYFDYLNTNFFKINIVIFLVDIQSGLNTSDEMDILKLITQNTHKQFIENKRKIYTLVIVNKCDDLQIKTDSSNSDKEVLYLDDELHEMYEQVCTTVRYEFDKTGISENLIDIIHMSALDSYLYRMIEHHGSNYKIKDADMLKIGINNCGKSFGKKSKEIQCKEVEKIINDKEFVKDMIKMSGFAGLQHVLYDFLTIRNFKNELIISNIEFSLIQLPKILYIVKFNIIKDIISYTSQYKYLFIQLKEIDLDYFNLRISTFIDELHEGYSFIISSLKTINKIKDYYDNINTEINIKFFSEYIDTKKYPSYVIEKIITIIDKNFKENIIDINEFIRVMYMLEEFDLFKKDIVQHLLDTLIENIHGESTFIIYRNFTPLITILSKINDELKIDLTIFMRFFIINIINSDIMTYDELVIKKMIYTKYNEISINSYLSMFLIKKYNFSEYKIFLRGINKQIIGDSLNAFDLYYILYEKIKQDL